MWLICLFLPESQQGALVMEWTLDSGLIHFTSAFLFPGWMAPLSLIHGASLDCFWPSQRSPLPCPLLWVCLSCFLFMFALVVCAFPLVWWRGGIMFWIFAGCFCLVLTLHGDPQIDPLHCFPCLRLSFLIFSTIAAYLFLILTCCLWIVCLFVWCKSNFILLMLEGCCLCLLT